jgi:hypothetical protein
VDFNSIRLQGSETECCTRIGGFSGERQTPKVDIYGFASILFEIVFGRPVQCELYLPTDVPYFISKIIETGPSLSSKPQYSFHDVFEILKLNDFKIPDDVDSEEVSTFVSWVDFVEK